MMLGFALLMGISLLIGGLAIHNSPQSLAGSANIDFSDPAEVKRYIRLKSRLLSVAGCIIIAGGIIAQMTGIGRIFVWSIFLPLAVVAVVVLYSTYKIAKNKRVFFKMQKEKFFVLAAACLFVAFLFICFTGENKLEIRKDTVTISGLYGAVIPVKEIESVKLLRQLPEISWRTNGFAFGYNLEGYFKLKENGVAKMFIHSSGPLIEIQTPSRSYFINFKDPVKTQRYYTRLVSLTE